MIRLALTLFQSGVLLQSPNVVDAVSLTINGVELLVSGTLHIQAESDAVMVLRQFGRPYLCASEQPESMVGQRW